MKSKTEKFKVFIVEDDAWYAETLTRFLSLNPDLEVESFGSGEEMLDQLYRNPSVLTLDYSLPGIFGERLLKKILEQKPGLPIIMLSGQENVSLAVKLLREGAYDYIVKDENTEDRLWGLVHHLKDTWQEREKHQEQKANNNEQFELITDIKGSSPAIVRILNLLEKASRTDITVSITGETGTGKELAAKTIHESSSRKKAPFVAVNVSAIPSELMESELFGHEKGSFTGANERRIGKFEEAHKGIIFLDEIGDMGTNMQTKLLRVLQEKEITRVGSNETHKIDCRVIVATHKDLAEEVKNGNFREDLYYRILGLPVEMPPLRDRGKDIILLAEKFLKGFCKRNNMDTMTISGPAKEKLMKYAYPGNVRELKALIELTAVMASESEILAADINFQSGKTARGFLLEEKSLKEYTEDIIRHFLDKHDGNVMLVANKLDIGKSTIYRLLQQDLLTEEKVKVID